MTLTQLLDFPPGYESLTDAEIKAICAPYLHITRPEAVKEKKQMSAAAKEKERKIAKARQMAKEMGFEL